MNVDIESETKDAMERSGIPRKRIAMELGTTPQNITNWLEPQRTFPLRRLVDLANYLDDTHFKFKIFEYLFHLPILSERQLNGNTPIAWIVNSSREERERHSLELHVQEILNDPPEMVTDESLSLVEQFYKELCEEVESENSLQVSIGDWITQAKEAVVHGHQGFKQHESYLSNARR